MRLRTFNLKSVEFFELWLCYSSAELSFNLSLSFFSCKIIWGLSSSIWASIIKYHRLGGLWTTEIYFLVVWRLEGWLGWLGDGFLPDYRLFVSLWQKGLGSFGRGGGGLFLKSTTPIHEDFTFMTNHYPKSPPPNTITLGVRILVCEFGGGWGVWDRNIETTAKGDW